MLDYLKKFNSLPPRLRQQVSNPTAMARLETLEKKYRLPLAALVMRILVKEISLADLASYLKSENLTETAAARLDQELRDKIFFSLTDYLSADGVPPPVLPGESRRGAQAGGSLPATEFGAPAPAVKGASFFFSVDDEEEIRQLTKKIDLAAKKELTAETVEAKLKAIIDRAQINFGAADLADRFRQILKTYLRGIRNKVETKATLVKPFLSGGLSFDQASAQQVMDLTDKVLNFSTVESARPLPKTEVSLPERDAPYDFSKLTAAKPAASPAGPAGQPAPGTKPGLSAKQIGSALKKISRPEETEPELAAPASAAVKSGIKKVIAPLAEKKPLLREKEPGPMDEGPADDSGQTPFIRRRFEAGNSTSGQKVKVEDVKYVPKVMSPLDEIKYLDLVNFRRLDKDPARAVEKIKAKINLLAEENYGKRLEGIRRWRSSPVNRLYLEIGQKSIGENKPVDVIIEERKIAAGDYLTAAEFESIMDLNKSLRF